MSDLTKRAQEVGFERAALEAGAVVAGRGVPADFRQGWGVAAFVGRKTIAHHWTRTMELGDGAFGLLSECGVPTVSSKRVPLFGQGNAPFCARCENALMRKARKP